MERRTALVASIATGLSLAAGVVAFAAAGGAPILGMSHGRGAESGRATVPLVVHHVQTIEDDIVVSTRSTELPRAVARRAASTTPPPTTTPIRPMPVGCQQPQLEDNGVWNCDD